MDPDWIVLLAIALLGSMGSGFFSGSETGLVSLDRLRLKGRRETSTTGETFLQRLVARQESLMVSTLVGTNLFNIGTAVVVTALAEERWGAKSIIPVTVALTLLVFLWGELVPKAYFRRHAHGVMQAAGPLLLVAHFIFWPITATFRMVVSGVFTLLRRPRPGSLLASREELGRLLAERPAGGHHEQLTHMLDGVLRLYSTTSREAMIPLADVVSVPERTPTAEILDKVRRGGPTRLPVYRERVDHIIGLINVFDILYDPNPALDARTYLRPIEIVPDSQRIDVLLLGLRRKRSGMAAVVNEFGSCVGIVTIEDVIEEIVGELADEHESTARQVIAVGENAHLVDARTDLHDLERDLGLDLGGTAATTVGGLVLNRLGRVPEVGATLEIPGARIEVVAADRYGVGQVRVTRLRDGDGRQGRGGERKQA